MFRDLLAGLAGLWLIAVSDGSIAAPVLEVPSVFIGAKTDTAFLGLSQGLEEANLQGRFLGQHYTVEVVQDVAAGNAKAAAYFVAADKQTLHKVQQAHGSVPVFNLTLLDESLRSACLGNVLHIQPSELMLQHAVQQWRRLNPQSKAIAQAWDRNFEKYSAKQLNLRFQKTFKQAMDDKAWAGWAALKLFADTVARVQTVEPAKTLTYLRNELAFDGQKGVEMRFRPDGQLLQMVLLVENGKVMGEAPVQGVAAPEDLESLGKGYCTK